MCRPVPRRHARTRCKPARRRIASPVRRPTSTSRNEAAMRGRPFIALLPLTPALAGCSGWQSALDPHGPQARHLAELIWIFTAVCAAVWLLVMLALLFGVVRRRPPRPEPLPAGHSSERTAVRIIGTLAVLTGVIVLALTFLSYASQRKLYAKSDATVKINVTGHQWWWELAYDEP